MKSISRIFFLTKIHFLRFQKWPKINFSTGKKVKTAKNVISRKTFWFIWFHEFFCLDFFKFSGPLRYILIGKSFSRKFSWNWFHENSAGRGRDRGLYVMKMQILLWWQWKWCFYIQWIILFFSMLKSTYLVCLYVCIYNSNIFFLSIWDFLCGGNFGVPTFEFEFPDFRIFDFRIRISV